MQRGLLTLQGFGDLENPVAATDSARDRSPSPSRVSLNQALSEEYLQARAVLSSFISRTGSLDDLNRACEMFSSVVRQDEEYAPAWSGLGIAHLQYARHGLGGQMHVLEARRAFDRRSSSIPARSRPISTASTCFSRAAKKSPPATASSTSSSPPPTTGTSTSSPE